MADQPALSPDLKEEPVDNSNNSSQSPAATPSTPAMVTGNDILMGAKPDIQAPANNDSNASLSPDLKEEAPPPSYTQDLFNKPEDQLSAPQLTRKKLIENDVSTPGQLLDQSTQNTSAPTGQSNPLNLPASSAQFDVQKPVDQDTQIQGGDLSKSDDQSFGRTMIARSLADSQTQNLPTHDQISAIDKMNRSGQLTDDEAAQAIQNIYQNEAQQSLSDQAVNLGKGIISFGKGIGEGFAGALGTVKDVVTGQGPMSQFLSDVQTNYKTPVNNYYDYLHGHIDQQTYKDYQNQYGKVVLPDQANDPKTANAWMETTLGYMGPGDFQSMFKTPYVPPQNPKLSPEQQHAQQVTQAAVNEGMRQGGQDLANVAQQGVNLANATRPFQPQTNIPADLQKNLASAGIYVGSGIAGKNQSLDQIKADLQARNKVAQMSEDNLSIDPQEVSTGAMLTNPANIAFAIPGLGDAIGAGSLLDVTSGKVLQGLGKVASLSGDALQNLTDFTKAAGVKVSPLVKKAIPESLGLAGYMLGNEHLGGEFGGLVGAGVGKGIGHAVAPLAGGLGKFAGNQLAEPIQLASNVAKMAGQGFTQRAADLLTGKQNIAKLGLAPNFLGRMGEAAVKGGLEAAPFAALISDNDPEKEGQIIGGVGALKMAGAALPDIQRAATNNIWDSPFIRGASPESIGADPINYSDNKDAYANPDDLAEAKRLDALHNQTIKSLNPQQAQNLNDLRYMTQGPMEIRTVPNSEFNRQVASVSTPSGSGFNDQSDINARGIAIKQNPNGPTQIFIRPDAIGTALNHEVGHPFYDMLPDDVKSQFDTIAAQNNDLNQFTQRYTRQLTNKPVSFDDLPSEVDITSGIAQPHPDLPGLTQEKIRSEMGAEMVNQLFNGQSILDYTKEPTLVRRLQFGLGQILEKYGINPTSPDAVSILGVKPSFTSAVIMDNLIRSQMGGIEPPAGYPARQMGPDREPPQLPETIFSSGKGPKMNPQDVFSRVSDHLLNRGWTQQMVNQYVPQDRDNLVDALNDAFRNRDLGVRPTQRVKNVLPSIPTEDKEGQTNTADVLHMGFGGQNQTSNVLDMGPLGAPISNRINPSPKRPIGPGTRENPVINDTVTGQQYDNPATLPPFEPIPKKRVTPQVSKDMEKAPSDYAPRAEPVNIPSSPKHITPEISREMEQAPPIKGPNNPEPVIRENGKELPEPDMEISLRRSGYSPGEAHAMATGRAVPHAGDGTTVTGRATFFGLEPPISNPYGTKIDWKDNGRGAFGYNTRNPALVGASLPVSEIVGTIGDYRTDKNVFAAIQRGDYKVRVTASNGRQMDVKLVDSGPADWTGNALDMTYGLGKALGVDDNTHVSYQIIGPDGNPMKIRGVSEKVANAEGKGSGIEYIPKERLEAGEHNPDLPEGTGVEQALPPNAPESAIPQEPLKDPRLSDEENEMYHGIPASGQVESTPGGATPEAQRTEDSPLTQQDMAQAHDEALATIPRGRKSQESYDDKVFAQTQKNIAESHSMKVDPDDPRMKLNPDTGKITGTQFNLNDEVNRQWFNNMHPDDQDKLQQIQQAIKDNQLLHIDYAGAPVHSMEKTDVAQTRAKELQMSPSAARQAGEADIQMAGKTLIPTDMGVSLSKKTNEFNSSFFRGYDPAIVEDNASRIIKAAGDISPYKTMDDPSLYSDMEGYIQNVNHGWKGDGSGPLRGTFDVPVSSDLNYTPYPLPKAKSQFLNMAMGLPSIEGPGLTKKGTVSAAGRRQEFYAENDPGYEYGQDSNDLRKLIDYKMPTAGPNQTKWSARSLEPAFRSYNTQLTKAIATDPSTLSEPIRPSVQKMHDVLNKGTPNRQGYRAIQAGFMPGERSTVKSSDFEKQYGIRLSNDPDKEFTLPQLILGPKEASSENAKK